MSDDENNNGDSADPDLEAQRQMQEQMQQLVINAAQGVANTLQHLAPHLGDEDLWQLSVRAAEEQLGSVTAEILPNIFDPVAAAKHPTLWLRISRAGASEDDKTAHVMMKAPKRLDRVRDVSVAAQHVVLLAFLFAPAARALLRAYGYTCQIGASAEDTQGSVILKH